VSDLIVVEQQDAIATVTFNRPQVRNAFSLAMWREIGEVGERLAKEESVRAVVYRGAGTKAFASGADISEFKEVRKDIASAQAYNRQTEAAYASIRSCPKPTVAMIYGFCMGGAMAIAMACDLRFVAAGSKFGIPAARLGIIYGLESVRQLVDLVGPSNAKDILFSGRRFDAEEALAMGFVNRILPPEDLQAFTYDYLKRVAANAPLSVRGAKATVEAIQEGLDDRHRERLRKLSLDVFDSHDYREGVQAFLEKRPPRFEGR
jgi:enoyl-CoA hydratase/carnithine racemase